MEKPGAFPCKTCKGSHRGDSPIQCMKSEASMTVTSASVTGRWGGSPLSPAGLSASFPDSLLTSPLLLAHSVWGRSQGPTCALSRLYPCLWIDSGRHIPHSVKRLMPHPFGLLYQWTCRDKILRQVLQYLWAFKASTEAMKSEFVHLPSCHQHPESPPTLPGATSSLAKDACIRFS